MWLGISVIKVLARCARGPGFESRSGHVLVPLVTFDGQCGGMQPFYMQHAICYACTFSTNNSTTKTVPRAMNMD